MILLFCIIDWRLHRHSDGIPPVVPVELITIGDETNISAMVRRQLALPPSEVQASPSAAPSPPELAPTYEMKIFPQKPHDASKSRKNTNESIVSNEDNTDQKPGAGPMHAKVGDYNIKASGDGMTMSVVDALRNQIAHCWHPPKDAAGIVVSFELYLSIDGSVQQPPRLVAERMSPDLAAVAETVRRAIYTCAPYRLPESRFRDWHNVVLTFDTKIFTDSRAPL